MYTLTRYFEHKKEVLAFGAGSKSTLTFVYERWCVDGKIHIHRVTGNMPFEGDCATELEKIGECDYESCQKFRTVKGKEIFSGSIDPQKVRRFANVAEVPVEFRTLLEATTV